MQNIAILFLIILIFKIYDRHLLTQYFLYQQVQILFNMTEDKEETAETVMT